MIKYRCSSGEKITDLDIPPILHAVSYFICLGWQEHNDHLDVSASCAANGIESLMVVQIEQAS
jgi:hypothetical protein